MSRNLFDDIFDRLGLKASLHPQQMDEVVPKQGSILGGHDFRTPFASAGLENALAQTDTSFARPMSANDMWHARALSAEYARKPLEPGMGAMPAYRERAAAPFAQNVQEGELQLDPEKVRTTLQEAQLQLDQSPDAIQPQPIPQGYFDVPKPSMLDRAYKYGREVDDAFLRATSNNIMPSFDAGDHFAARMGAWTGIDGNRGDYEGNLKRQRTNSALAQINSPLATDAGVLAGSFLGGRLLRSVPTVRGIIKNGPPNPPPAAPRGIPLRTPPKSRKRFDDY